MTEASFAPVLRLLQHHAEALDLVPIQLLLLSLSPVAAEDVFEAEDASFEPEICERQLTLQNEAFPAEETSSIALLSSSETAFDCDASVDLEREAEWPSTDN